LQTALMHLQTAWNEGFREPEAAFAMGRTLGALYLQSLAELETINNREEREARRQNARARYRDPALVFLAQGSGADIAPPEYLRGLIALFEERFEDALAAARAVVGERPWFYEAVLLEGDVRRLQASTARAEGRPDDAETYYRRAADAYGKAAEIGRSDPNIFRSAAVLYHSWFFFELYGKDRVQEPFANGMAQLDAVLSIHPDDHEALLLRGRMYRGYAEYLVNTGQDPEPTLKKAGAAVNRALQRHAEDARALAVLGAVYWQAAKYHERQSIDPRPDLERALDAYRRAPEHDRDESWHNAVGLVHKSWADYLQGLGEDAGEQRLAAVNAFKRAGELAPNRAMPRINLGIAQLKAAEAGGPDRVTFLQAAVETLDGVRTIAPNNIVPYYYLGKACRLLAHEAGRRNENPIPYLQKAADWLKAGQVINPNRAQFANELGILHVVTAQTARRHGLPTDTYLRQALAQFEKARDLSPKRGAYHSNLSWAWREWALFRLEEGKEPEEQVNQSLAAAEEAVKLSPNHWPAYNNMACAYWIQARGQRASDLDPGPSLGPAVEAVNKALALAPKAADVHLTRGRIFMEKARQGVPGNNWWQKAREAFQTARAFQKDHLEVLLALAEWHRVAAENKSNQAPADLEEWEAVLNEALTLEPALARASTLKAALAGAKTPK
ncbi:MAG: hypothetical protein QNK37_24745, partial [Acidobacteriota bacterium]|nr:hypothetical protein [Acidobacteriota bacterium]